MEDIIGIILLCITAAFILSEFFERLRLPRILGGFFVGMTLGLPIIKDFLFSNESLSVINSFGMLGDIFITFYIGMNINFSEYRKHTKLGVFFALLTYFIPFAGGFVVARLLGYGWMVSFLIAGCITLIAEDVPMEILNNRKLSKSKILHFLSRVMLGGDFFEVIFLTVIFTYAGSFKYPENYRIILIIAFLILFIILLYIARYLVVPFILRIVEGEHSTKILFASALIVALFMASLSTYLGLGNSVGALMGGLIIRHVLSESHKRKKILEKDRIASLLDTTIVSFFAPFFFIYIGLLADWTVLIRNPGLGIIITLVAFFGKLVASISDFFFRKVDFLTSFVAGIGANSKGTVELIAASAALRVGMVTIEIFSAIVFMTFVLSLLSPMLFSFLLLKFRARIS